MIEARSTPMLSYKQLFLVLFAIVLSACQPVDRLTATRTSTSPLPIVPVDYSSLFESAQPVALGKSAATNMTISVINRIVAVTSDAGIYGYDLDDGSELWFTPMDEATGS